MFAPLDSGGLQALRTWPTQYVYTGAIQPPTLPSGVSIRHYCDIEILPDGDIVVTIAQDPLYDDTLREGWIRYNHATSTWESPVTSYFTYNFLQTSKGGLFERSDCMTVDTNYFNPYEIVFASNNAVTSSGAECTECLWNFDLNTSGIFSLNWFRPVPTEKGYGSLQGVAVLSPGRILVQHDWDPTSGPKEDRLQLLNTSGSPITQIGMSWQRGTDLWGVAAMTAGYTATCDYWLAFSTRAAGAPNATVPANACATLYAMEVSACD
jgi:hypothetical protein